MAKKKIYKHHQRSTIAQALTDAQTREVVLGSGERQAGLTFADGNKLVLNNLFDIKAFGAVGDGSTNDRTAINLAIAAASSAGGGIIFVPPGTFMLNQDISIPSNCILQGVGPSSIIKSTASTSWVYGSEAQGIIQVKDSASNVTIRDITVDGNKSASATGTCFGIAVWYGANNVNIERVRAINCPGSDASGNTGGDGIYIGDGSNGSPIAPYNVVVSNCFIDGNVRTGIAIASGKNIRIVNNTIIGTTGDGTGSGIDIEPDPNAGTNSIEGVAVIGNRITGNNHGIALPNQNQAVFRGVFIAGNLIEENRAAGIYMTDMRYGAIFIQGNTIRKNYADGIQVQAGSGTWSIAVEVSGNHIENNYRYGIDLRGNSARQFRISNNLITMNSMDGIRIAYANNGYLGHFITRNQIFNNGWGNVAAAGLYDGINMVGDATYPTYSCIVEDNHFGNRDELGGSASLNGIVTYKTITFQAGGYVSAVEADLGHKMVGGMSGATAVLKGFDNATRRWIFETLSGTFSNGEAITISRWTSTPSSGTGTGTTNSAQASFTGQRTQRWGVIINANADKNVLVHNSFYNLISGRTSVPGGTNNIVDDSWDEATAYGKHTAASVIFADANGSFTSASGFNYQSATARVGHGTPSPDVPYHQAFSSINAEGFFGETDGSNRLGGFIRWTRSVGADGGSYSGGLTLGAKRLGSENRPVAIGGRRVRIQADTTGTIDDHSSNVALEIDHQSVKLGDRRLQMNDGAAVASANDLALGTDGNYFVVTGTTTINGIQTASWQAGAHVILRLQSGLTLKHDTPPSAGYAKLWMQTAADYVAPANTMIMLLYDGTYWREINGRNAV